MLFRKISVLFAVVSMTSLVAHAQGRQAYRNTQSVSSSDVAHHNYISAALGFLAPGANTLVGTVNGQPAAPTAFSNSGLIGIGGDYDYMLNKDFSVGGMLRYYSCSSTINSNNVQNTLFTLGAEAKAYLPQGDFVPYVGAGFAFMAPGVTAGNQTYNITSGLGLIMSLGILYNITDTVSLGIETMRLTGLSSSINGNLTEDYMLKGRFALAN